jgi:hypothetical protein
MLAPRMRGSLLLAASLSFEIKWKLLFYYRMVIVFATGKTMVLHADGEGRKK